MKDLTVIFDIDGVIVDSEQLHFDVLYTLAPEQARNFTPHQLIGLSLQETLDHIHVPAAQQPEIIERIVETYKAKLTAHYLRPDIAMLIKRLEQQGVRFGFVSTAPRDVCLANIGLLGLSAEPDLISGDDVARTKPHPDPYLAMLKQLQADTGNTLVIEDTDMGIRSASEAGISRIYAWPHALSGQQHYHQATAVIEQLDDIADFAALKKQD